MSSSVWVTTLPFSETAFDVEIFWILGTHGVCHQDGVASLCNENVLRLGSGQHPAAERKDI